MSTIISEEDKLYYAVTEALEAGIDEDEIFSIVHEAAQNLDAEDENEDAG